MPRGVLYDEEKVLQQAMQLFWLRGYNGTSLDDLMKATSLSRSSIYNSFGDKHGIFLQSLNYYKDLLLKKIRNAVAKLHSPVEKIEMIFRLSNETLSKDKERKGCLIVNTSTELASLEEGIVSFMQEYMAEIESIFQELVKEGQISGEISKTFPPTALAKYLYNSYSGIKVIAKTTSDRKVLDDIVNISLSVLKT